MIMKHLPLVLMLMLALVQSCATTTPGKAVETNNSKVAATVTTNPTFSNENFQMYQVTFKNNTNEWIEYSGAQITDNSTIKILVGNKLNAWLEACKIEREVADYDTSLLLAGLAAGGGLVAGASSHSSTSQLGTAVSLGAVGATMIRGFSDATQMVEFQNALPDSHLFKGFSIPPKKAIRRWVLIENPDSQWLKVKLVDQKGEALELKL